MSTQSCLLGGVIRTLSLDISEVNQVLRQMGQIIHWATFFQSYCFKLLAIYKSHHCPGLYSVDVFSWLSSLPSVLEILLFNEILDSGAEIANYLQQGAAIELKTIVYNPMFPFPKWKAKELVEKFGRGGEKTR